ncbi:MAG: winged helix-turn-helix domain-containing protein [Pseudomonadota bacterium]
MYRFGEFELDPSTRLLTRNAAPIRVEPQVFALLVFLIENRHRVVTKEELISSIWKGRIVSDSAISSRVKSARQAVNDSGRSQIWIKTVHGLGFRFVGSVTADQDVAVSTPTPDALASARDAGEEQRTRRPGVVVLPLEAVGEHVDPVFSLGFAHDITVNLSRLRWLRVIARATAFRLSEQAASPADLQTLVGVRYRVVGSVQRKAQGFLVIIQLDDLIDGSVLWTDRIDFGDSELDAARHSLVCQIAGAIEREIGAAEARNTLLRATDSLSAWEAYHRGMTHYHCFTARDNQIAVELFKRAISLDSGFARAHAGLSSAAFQNAFNGYAGIKRRAAIDEAQEHARLSIQLDRLDPVANFASGRVHWLLGNPGESLPWLERAVALNPSFAQAYYAHGLASLLSNDGLRGYTDSAQAIELSPLDPFLYGFLGVMAFSHLADGDFENAAIWAEKAANQPEALVVMDLLAAATCCLDARPQSAEAWVRRALSRNPHFGAAQFFTALPFAQGSVRELLTGAFDRLGIHP